MTSCCCSCFGIFDNSKFGYFSENILDNEAWEMEMPTQRDGGNLVKCEEIEKPQEVFSLHIEMERDSYVRSLYTRFKNGMSIPVNKTNKFNSHYDIVSMKSVENEKIDEDRLLRKKFSSEFDEERDMIMRHHMEEKNNKTDTSPTGKKDRSHSARSMTASHSKQSLASQSYLFDFVIFNDGPIASKYRDIYVAFLKERYQEEQMIAHNRLIHFLVNSKACLVNFNKLASSARASIASAAEFSAQPDSSLSLNDDMEARISLLPDLNEKDAKKSSPLNTQTTLMVKEDKSMNRLSSHIDKTVNITADIENQQQEIKNLFFLVGEMETIWEELFSPTSEWNLQLNHASFEHAESLILKVRCLPECDEKDVFSADLEEPLEVLKEIISYYEDMLFLVHKLLQESFWLFERSSAFQDLDKSDVKAALNQ